MTQMRRVVRKPGWRRRFAWLAVLGLAAMLSFYVTTAGGDAGNPILGTIQGKIVPDPSGPGVTVYVRGEWNWISHGSDCNFDRAATGVGIIWNDPNGADRTRTIGAATRSGTTVTITTTAAQAWDVGDHISVSGVSGGTGYNGGPFVVTARSNTSLKYTNAGTGSGSGGTVTDLDVFNGFEVQKSPIKGYVGTSTATAGNVVDEMVHPVDRGNVPEGYTAGTWKSTTQGYTSNAAGDYPSGQAFTDPSPPGITNTQVAAWKGGCGREPISAIASKTIGGQQCADGSAVCSNEPWGSWGYEMNGGQGYSHHFARLADVTKVCANFYDVHGGGKFGTTNFQKVNGTKEITVDGNSDNSIETNAFNTAAGANCYSFSTTGSSTTTQQAVVPNDTATVTGNNPTGTVDFALYGPGDSACTGAPAFAQSRPLTNGQASTDNSAPFVASTPGTWRWKLHYSGDANNPSKDSPCGTEQFTIANS
jgi:hypothetical protein